VLRERASDVGMIALRDLYSSAESMVGEPAQVGSASNNGEEQRFTCGVYFYSTTDSGKDQR
jgi:hypothetical protein